MMGQTSIYNGLGQIIPTSAGSTALFTNLNADLLDGRHGSEYALASTISDALITIVAGSGLTAGGTFSLNQTGAKSITLTHYTPESVASNITASTNKYISAVTFDAYGHATGVSTATVDFNVSANYAFSQFEIAPDTGFTWTTANNGTPQYANSASSVLELVNGTGINFYTSTVTATPAIKIEHSDTSTLSGVYGANGIAAITVDGFGHITGVTAATFLTAESDTLATVTGRGATTASAITINNTTASTSTSTGALLVAGGLGITGQITNGGGILITNTTASTTPATGALRVAGGAGITGNLNVGGNAAITGTLLVSNTTNATSTTSGAFQVRGGIGATGNIYAGGTVSSAGIESSGPVIVSNATDSSSTSTGSITTTGGAGIAKSLFVGGSVNIAGNLFVGGTSSIINSGQVTIKDTILWLGGTAGSTAGDIFDKGVIYSYWDNTGSTSKKGFFGWDESEDKFVYLSDATETAGVVTGTPGTIKAGQFEGGTFNGYLNGNALTATTATTALGTTGALIFGTYFNTVGNFNGSEDINLGLDASSTNTANYLVARDAQGGFSAENVILVGLTASGPVKFTNNTASTSTSTGALVLTGGVGIGGSANIGGNLNVTGPVSISDSTASTSTSTGALLITGGLGITGQITNGGGILITNTTASTTPATGALRVAGGAGITGNLNVGGNVGVTGTLTIGQTATVGNLTTSGKIITTNSTASTNPTTGALLVTGGVGIGGSANIGGALDVRGEIRNSTSAGTLVASSNVNSVTIATGATTAVDTFSLSSFRSMKYLIQITQSTNYQVSEVLVLHNDLTTNMTEYAILESGSPLANITSAINGANVELRVTMSSATSATIVVHRTGLINTNP